MQSLPVTGVSTAMQARQISDKNGCNVGVFNKFHLLSSCKASLHHKTIDDSVLLPPPPPPTGQFVRVRISC